MLVEIYKLLIKNKWSDMKLTEKRINANKRNWELGRKKWAEIRKQRTQYNNELVPVECICEHCHNAFTKMIKRIDAEKHRLPKHCSRSCANARKRTDDVKMKVSKALSGVKFVDGQRVQVEPRTCKGCGVILRGKKCRRYCSPECKRNHQNHMNNGTFIGTYRQYRQACLFKFSLASYPEEFDFELIKKYGFYSPKNKKDNPNGVSRDHMYSVREGLANNVPPWILAHPANCRLMLYLDNVSKNKHCSITLDELKERIRLWDEKYGEYVPNDKKTVKY